MAASASAWAQSTTDQPLRGSIAPGEAGEDAGPTPASPDGTRPALAARATPEGTRPPQPLGGMGDQPPTNPREGPDTAEAEEPVAPEEGRALDAALGLAVPDTEEEEPAQIHSALAPEPHDLEPYVPIGIRLGSFVLYPEAEFGTILTNNVLDTRIDARSDAALEFAPKLRLESDWSRHAFSAEVNSDRSWYNIFPIEDENNYQIVLRGRIDVTARTHLRAEAEKSQTQQGPSSISLTDIAGAQTKLHEEHVTASADHTFNRLTLKLSGTLADYNYDDIADPTLTGPVPFLDIRDYREAVGTLRSTYEFQSSWAGFIETSVNERDYREPITSSGLRRGSSGTAVLGGLNLRLAGTLFGEISAGWGQQQPIDNGFQPVSGPLLNADLIWLPTPVTKVEFLARSEIDETTLQDSLGAIDRFYELSLQHAFWRYLVLGAYGSYEVADFVGDPEIDQRLKGGVTAEYYLNPVTSLYGRYEHTAFISTDTASDFNEDEVRMGLKLRR